MDASRDFPSGTPRTPLPAAAGIGFKPAHFDALVADAMPPAFLEVHAENLMGDGGRPHAQLDQLRARMPLSIHGVGLSIGGEDPLDALHLQRLARLLRRHPPAQFSEHLAWSTHGGEWFGDLLPLPYTDAVLRRVCAHVDQVQHTLGVRMLLENPSTYVAFGDATWDEPAFLAEVVRRTGCGLLLDVNNLLVSARNHGRDPFAALGALPLGAVGELHLAGHARVEDATGAPLWVDDHGSPVEDATWALYAHVIGATGPLPTLIEWDTDVPAYAVLRAEAHRADAMLDLARRARAGAAA